MRVKRLEPGGKDLRRSKNLLRLIDQQRRVRGPGRIAATGKGNLLLQPHHLHSRPLHAGSTNKSGLTGCPACVIIIFGILGAKRREAPLQRVTPRPWGARVEDLLPIPLKTQLRSRHPHFFGILQEILHVCQALLLQRPTSTVRIACKKALRHTACRRGCRSIFVIPFLIGQESAWYGASGSDTMQANACKEIDGKDGWRGAPSSARGIRHVQP